MVVDLAVAGVFPEAEDFHVVEALAFTERGLHTIEGPDMEDIMVGIDLGIGAPEDTGTVPAEAFVDASVVVLWCR